MHVVRATKDLGMQGSSNRGKNDDWEVGFLNPGKGLGFYSTGSGKPDRECHHLTYVLKRRFLSMEKALLL